MYHHNQPFLCLRGGGADQKRKEDRKRKFAQLQDDQRKASTEPESRKEDASTEQGARKKIKRASKSPQETKPRAIADAKQERNEAESDEKPESTPVVKIEPDGDKAEKEDDQPQKAQRFIVFIGNLPYTATTASITAHFAKVQPRSTRHRTDKDTGKSKGFAFLEFAAYDRMKTCLKLYHHSMFDDGHSPARKINVELTVGGGGTKSTERKTKLKAKNWKLTEERRRRAEEEAKAENKKGRKKGGGEGKENGEETGKSKGKGKSKSDNDERVAADEGDIHPSRRSRVSTG